ncbi:MAG: hypothetical protein OEN50_19575, partial [Deltaproteobacteria bacterium]|nr:hypothetical protein [Deltaproteobacteria bacterium]
MTSAKTTRSNEGRGELCVNIAGIAIAMTSDDSNFTLDLQRGMEKFLVDPIDPDVRVQAGWGDLSTEKGGNVIFDSGGVWRLSVEDGIYRFCFFSPLFGSLPYKAASFSPDFSFGKVVLHRPYFPADRAIYPLEYPLDELVLMHLLARGRGAEVHACGVVDDLGNGHLFIGQSGGGKTTMARLWEKQKGITILSDDRIVLREIENRIWMYGTPWHGEASLAEASRAPLKRIYFLRHGEKNAL